VLNYINGLIKKGLPYLIRTLIIFKMDKKELFNCASKVYYHLDKMVCEMADLHNEISFLTCPEDVKKINELFKGIESRIPLLEKDTEKLKEEISNIKKNMIIESLEK